MHVTLRRPGTAPGLLAVALALALPLALAGAAPAGAQEETPRTQPRHTALTAHATVKVPRVDDAAEAIIALAESRGGFLDSQGAHRLVVKVPPEAVSEVLDGAAAQGLLLAKRLERGDLTELIAQLEASLRSKSAILDRLRRFFDDADVESTLRVEKEMNELVEELERVKGRLRVARERAAWAVIQVHFRLPERERVRDASSSFEWINSCDLDRFLGDFHHDD